MRLFFRPELWEDSSFGAAGINTYVRGGPKKVSGQCLWYKVHGVFGIYWSRQEDFRDWDICFRRKKDGSNKATP